MSGKKRFQKPGSLQPNIDDILEWSKLPEDAFDAASSQEKADFIKDRKSVSYWADAWRRLRKNKVAMVALAIIIALVIFGFVGPSLVPYTYKQQVRGSEALHPWHYTLEDQQKINDYMEEKNQTANLTPDEAVFARSAPVCAFASGGGETFADSTMTLSTDPEQGAGLFSNRPAFFYAAAPPHLRRDP